MIEKYVLLNRSLRSIKTMIRELIDAEYYDENTGAVETIKGILNRALSDFERMWPKDLDNKHIYEIGKNVYGDDRARYWTMLETNIVALEDALDDYFSEKPYGELSYGILDILHPRVTAAGYVHFRASRYRDAVLNSIVAVFDLIRDKTKLDLDGSELVSRALSLQNPILILSNLDTESGKNEQKGYIQILQGAYLGIRNPKAHTLTSDMDQVSAAQRLVFASMLCHKIDESTLA